MKDYLPTPNYTQVPNFIIDDGWMAKLSYSEYKVLNLILRYTSGFHRREASISYSHFEEKCGVTKKWVRVCANKLESYGWIEVIRGDATTSNIYRLRLQPHESDEIVHKKESTRVLSTPDSGVLSTPGVEYSVPPINKEQKERDIKKAKERKMPAGGLSCSFQIQDKEGNPVPRVHRKHKDFDGLSPEHKEVYNLFMSLLPMKDDDEPLKPYTVVNWLTNAGMGVQRAKAIIGLYLQDCKRYKEKGQTIENMGGYITKSFQNQRVGEPDHAQENRKWWDDKKKGLPSWVYRELEKAIDFPYAGKDVSFMPEHEEFKDQIRKALVITKEMKG